VGAQRRGVQRAGWISGYREREDAGQAGRGSSCCVWEVVEPVLLKLVSQKRTGSSSSLFLYRPNGGGQLFGNLFPLPLTAGGLVWCSPRRARFPPLRYLSYFFLDSAAPSGCGEPLFSGGLFFFSLSFQRPSSPGGSVATPPAQDLAHERGLRKRLRQASQSRPVERAPPLDSTGKKEKAMLTRKVTYACGRGDLCARDDGGSGW
jgi:hypothetical protein